MDRRKMHSLPLLLAVLITVWPSGAGGRLWSSILYPDEILGPYNWRYYRVDLPVGFSGLSISLTRRLSSNTADEQKNVHDATHPLVCFGFHGPPLIVPPKGSLVEAITTSGGTQSASFLGECGWFKESITINVTNLQVPSGILHVGIFSDSTSARNQAKMISRGKTYAFSLEFQVRTCQSLSRGGPDCNTTITSLCDQTSEPNFSSTSVHLELSPQEGNRVIAPQLPPIFHTEKSKALGPLVLDKNEQQRLIDNLESLPLSADQRNDNVIQCPTQSQSTLRLSDQSKWASSPKRCVTAEQWLFYSLHIVNFLTKLEIKIYLVPKNLSQQSTSVRSFGPGPQYNITQESQEGGLYIRFGALPGLLKYDFMTNISSASISIDRPRRGWLYLGIFNSVVSGFQNLGNATQASEDSQCFMLGWRAESCETKMSERDCKWPVVSLQRVLTHISESPFDSNYLPSRHLESVDSKWFPLLLPTKNNSAQWEFFILEVPVGSAGAVLSADIKLVDSQPVELYARYDGYPTLEYWDFRETSVMSKGLGRFTMETDDIKSRKVQPTILSLHVVYPKEGVWCLGVRHLPNQVTKRTVSTMISKFGTQIGTESKSGWIGRLLAYLAYLQKTIRHWESTVCADSTLKVSMEHSDQDLDQGHNNLHPGTNLNSHDDRYVSSEQVMEMNVYLHGCPSRCSGHGTCHTDQDGDRLHHISYCYCDLTHGGFDCSTTLLGPANELKQLWALIGSNVAAILPSIWTLHQKMYSEWITFMFSGMASAVYHSCDAGGWCVLSFDTLQFLDFWLSFLAIVMTCLFMAGFMGTKKEMFHVGAAILTAAIAKENATSMWSVLLVVFMSSTALLLGWALESPKFFSSGSWGPISSDFHTTFAPTSRWCRSMYVQMKNRFNWFYLLPALALLLFSILALVEETAETYWIWHSFWHVSIYTSACLFLHSVVRETTVGVSGSADRPAFDYESVPHETTSEGTVPVELYDVPQLHSGH